MKVAVAGATGRVGRHAVDVLNERGHEVVAISRSAGVDVITGDGLADSMTGVDAVIDAATGPSPDEEPLPVSGRAWPGFRPVRNPMIPYRGIFFAHMVEHLPG
jgi:putative NADH-flavin reductase